MFQGCSLSISKLGLSRFFQLPFNVMLARVLPFSFLRAYIYVLGLIYFFINKGERKRVFLGVTYVLGKWFDRSALIITMVKTFQGIFDHYYEKLLLAYRPLTELIGYLEPRFTIQNQRFLDEAIRDGRGVLIVTGHFGAVEYLPLAMSMRGYKIAMIVRFKTAKLKEQLLDHARNMDVLAIDGDEPNVAFKAMKALKSGRILITECDEFKHWRPHADNCISVFGNAVPRDKCLDFFYHRAGLPAFLGLMRRDRKGNVTFCLEHLADGEREISLAEKAWGKIEKYIMNYPEQWYQWKDAVPELAAYIDWKEINGNSEDIYLPSEYPVFSADLA